MKNERGFITLIELMIIMAIFGILAAVAIPKIDALVNRYKAEKQGYSQTQKSGKCLACGRAF